MQSFSHPEGATFGSATRSPELFDSLESPMLKEKDLRSFKKRLKGYESQKLLGLASRSALLLTTFGRPVPDLGSQLSRLAWEQWTARRDPGLFQDCAILNRHAMGTARKLLRKKRYRDVKELAASPHPGPFLLLWWRSKCATSFLESSRVTSPEKERLNQNYARIARAKR